MFKFVDLKFGAPNSFNSPSTLLIPIKDGCILNVRPSFLLCLLTFEEMFRFQDNFVAQNGSVSLLQQVFKVKHGLITQNIARITRTTGD